MIIHSLLLFSIIFNTLGISGLADKLDRSYLSSTYNHLNLAAASLPGISYPEIAPRPVIDRNAPESFANAKRYLLADLDSSVVLARQNEHEKVPIASTTKIMTASLVLENYRLDDIVTISAEAAGQIGADANFVPGERITVQALLECLLIKSANGAAYALAEHANGPGEKGTAKFIEMMNEKAKTLGMRDTEYHDAAGLDVTGFSSAYDLFTITKYALRKPTFAQIVTIKEDSVHDVSGKIWHKLENSNRLVREWDYPGAIGVKTGYMPEAGHCLVGAAKRDGHTLVSIVLYTYSDTASASAEESRRLLDWGFANITWQE